MRILYDYQIFEEQQFGGISRYYYELLNNYEGDADIEVSLFINYSKNIYLQSLKKFQNIPFEINDPYKRFLPNIQFGGKRKLFNLLTNKENIETNQELSIKTLSTFKYDIFHPTYFNPYYLDLLKNKPLVVTVLDMISEIYPEYYPLNSKVSIFKKLVTTKAAKIITISENTKRDLVTLFDLNPEKIEVIYLGNSLIINNSNVNSNIVLPKNYLLFVGNRTIYKNFYFLIKSIEKVLLSNKDLKIICTGQSFSDTEIDFFKMLGINDNMLHYFADDNLLAELYSNAIAFIFPSLYEGFGIPVLEAFNCGCPCLMSNTSSLPEVGGSASLYFDPKSAESIQSAVIKIISDTDLRQELRVKGYSQLQKFSWEKTAKQTKNVYQGLL